MLGEAPWRYCQKPAARAFFTVFVQADVRHYCSDAFMPCMIWMLCYFVWLIQFISFRPSCCDRTWSRSAVEYSARAMCSDHIVGLSPHRDTTIRCAGNAAAESGSKAGSIHVKTREPLSF